MLKEFRLQQELGCFSNPCSVALGVNALRLGLRHQSFSKCHACLATRFLLTIRPVQGIAKGIDLESATRSSVCANKMHANRGVFLTRECVPLCC